MKILERLRDLTSIIWTVSELALAVVAFSILIFILLGEGSGTFASFIVQNCINLLNDIGAQSVIGVTIVLFTYLYLRKRSE